ncbi:MAG TPA: hypothetical protein VFQ80_17700, partial [Thermomicrobiales bacterium]|nr:hypothetical protein [Thermomicrobiales bacterium]
MERPAIAATAWTRRRVLQAAGLGAAGLAAFGPRFGAAQSGDGEMDGWLTGTPEAYGVDPAALAEVHARVPT